MIITDFDRYEMCVRYARTMMMMALIMEEKYGSVDSGFQTYVRHGIESCKMAIYYRDLWKDDNTDIIQMVA